jgi:cyclopropane-fatty-acyl-phospholipid synthase
MATPVLRRTPSDDVDSSRALNFLQELLREYHPRNFAVEFWDGTCWEPEPGQFRRFGWKVKRAGALRPVFGSLTPLSFAEAFLYGDFDLDGDLEGLFPLLEYLLKKNWSPRQKERLDSLLAELPGGTDLRPARRAARLPGRVRSRERDRAAAEYHYGLSNDFYSLWLDKGMIYSCGYFRGQSESLELAQREKLDYVCRKLRLRPGERLLDIGCGWGGLIVHAAQEYGVNAVGITLSEQERRLAAQRIEQAELGGRCQVKLLDYRDLAEPEAFDKIASVEMLGHVGEEEHEEYFRRVLRALRPGGVLVLQFVAAPWVLPRPAGPAADRTYVLPDAEWGPLAAVCHAAESAGFELHDLENLREHYVVTLRHWLRGMTENAERSRRLLDEVTYRAWLWHVAEWAHEFDCGELSVYQAVLTKKTESAGAPCTREDWYAKPEVVKPPEAEPDPNEWTP